MAGQFEQIPTQTDDPVKPKALKEQDRVRLDNIVQQMVKNKEDDNTIRMVVEDFKNKYGQINSTAPAPKQTTQMLGMFKTVPYPSMQEADQLQQQERADKLNKAGSVLTDTWKDVDKYTRDLLYEKNKADERNMNPVLASESTKVNTFIPPELLKRQEQDERNSIPQEAIDAVKNDASTHRAILKRAIIVKKKEGKKEDAQKIGAAVYALDSDERDSPQVRENIKNIEDGKLIYNVQKQEIYKPLGVLESIRHGFAERNRANDTGGKLMLMSKSDRIKFAEEELKHYDPDKPIPVPGTISEMVGSEGIATLKSLSAGAVVGFLTKNPTAASTAAAAAATPEYSRRAYHDEFIRSYAQLKKTLTSQHPEWTEAQVQSVAEDKASTNAAIAATSDAVVNGLMTYSGLKLGGKALNINKIAFDRGALNALKQVTGGAVNLIKKGAPEALTNASIAAGAQGVKNYAANELGIKRDPGEGVGQAAAGMLTMQYMIAGLHYAGSGLGGAAKKTILNALAKQPIDITTKATTDLLAQHVITPIEADITIDAVKRQQVFQQQFPNVHEDATLNHLQNLTEEYNANKAKLDKDGGVHESLHPAIKERQKNLEWEINMLSETPENQIKILKTKQAELQKEIDEHDAAKSEGKPGKLEDRAGVKKQLTQIDKWMEQAQDKLDSPLYKAQKIIDEDIRDDYADWTQNAEWRDLAKSNPKEFLQFVAEQARSEVPFEGRTISARDNAVKTFGKDLVKVAEETFPERQPASVIRPGEIPSRETITIKPNDNAIQEQSAGPVDVRQSSGDGETMGTGNRLQETLGEEAPKITGETQEADLSAEPELQGTPAARLDKDNLTEFTTKSGRQTVRHEKGDLVVASTDGQPVSDATRRKALQEYAQAFDYSHGERATAPPEGMTRETDVKRHIIESSQNPLEIAELYAMEEPQTAPLSTVERMIADYGLGKVKRESYINFGDRNNIGMSKAKSYFSKDGAPIDVIAKEMSDHYGIEITPGDIVDFIDRFPNGVQEALRKVHTAVAGEAAAKFKKLTGLDLNREVAEKAIRQEFDKLTQLEKDLYEANYQSEKELQDLYWDTYEATNGFTEDGGHKPGSAEAKGSTREQPPVSPPPPAEPIAASSIHVQHPETILSHRGLQVVANEFGLEDVKPRDRKADIQLRADAEHTMRQWAAEGTYNENIEKLITDGERGSVWNDEQFRIVEQHLANLSEELRRTPINSAEFDRRLAGINRVKLAGEKTRSEAGAALRVSSLAGSGERTFADYMLREMDAGHVSKLTEQEKATAKAEYDKISKASDEYTASKAEDEAKAALAAETPTPKKKGGGTRKKKTHEDFANERKEIVQSIREKLRKARGESNIVVVPYAKELIAIAPDVVKMARNLLEEGVHQLGDVVKRIHTDLKDDLPELTEKDVHNILAGEYTQKKQTRNDIAERLRDLQTEARLMNKLDEALSGAEPKQETAKQKRNQRIEELTKQIKEVNRQHSNKSPEEIADKAAASRMQKEIEELKKKLAAGDYDKTPKKEVKYSEKTEKLREELYNLRHERDIRLAQKEYKNRPVTDKIVDVVTAPIREVRTVVAAFDASFPLRQGIVPTAAEVITNPGRTAKRFAKMLKAGGSKKYFDKWMADLKESPTYKMMMDSGLAIVDPDVVKNKEEIFQSKYAEKIPIVGTIGIKGSERAFAHFANSQRADLFMRGVEMMERRGMTYRNSTQEYKNWAMVVNTLTGRGNMQGVWAHAAKFLSLGFFSPRLIASRLSFFDVRFWNKKSFYRSIPAPLRLTVVGDMVKFVALGTGLLYAAKAMLPNAEVEVDPRSADFGKLRIGDTRWDIWGGFQQYVRLFSTLITQSKKTTSGQIVDLQDEKNTKNKSFSVAETFIRSKASPAVGAAWNIMAGETIVGEPTSFKQEAQKFFLPLLWKDVYDVSQQQDVATAIAVGITGFFGVGSQTYALKPPKRRSGSTAQRERRQQRERRER